MQDTHRTIEEWGTSTSSLIQCQIKARNWPNKLNDLIQ
jgi:hypothetical protein